MNQPKILWKNELNRTISISPIIVDDLLLVALNPATSQDPDSDLAALDIHSGDLKWMHHFEYVLISGLQAYTLLADDLSIGIISTQRADLLRGQGRVLALDKNGSVFWQWCGEEKSYAAPVVQEMQLLVLAGTNTLAIVNPEGDGNESVTRITLPITSSTSAPAVRGTIAYIPCRTPDLFAIDLTTSEQWHFHAPDHERNWLDQTPVLTEDTLFTVGRMGIIYALDSRNLKLRWQQEIGENRPLSQPAVDDNHVYVGTRAGLSVLDSQSGQTVWTFPTTRSISAQPLILGDVVYVSCEDHHLYALDKRNGDELWHLEMERRIEIPPVLTSSCLLVVDRGGQVVALEPPDLPEALIVKRSESVQMRKDALAQKFSERGEYSKAIDLWTSLGKLEKAAEAYEQAGEWQEAADMWRQLDRDGKRADALERYAQLLTEKEIDEEEVASAWERAARAHAELGQREARQRCEREAARYRYLPILVIEIEAKDLVIHQWSKLDFVVKNDGFGPARHVIVNLVDDRFVGRAKHSATWVTVMPNKQFANWLEVQPQTQGDEVPMQLLIEYVDRTGNSKTLERTFYLPVVREEETVTGSREFAYLKLPGGRDQISLRRNLVEFFSAEELDTLIFDLGARPDDFDSHLSVKAREIITWAAQHNQVNNLVSYCQKERPGVEW